MTSNINPTPPPQGPQIARLAISLEPIANPAIVDANPTFTRKPILHSYILSNDKAKPTYTEYKPLFEDAARKQKIEESWDTIQQELSQKLGHSNFLLTAVRPRSGKVFYTENGKEEMIAFPTDSPGISQMRSCYKQATMNDKKESPVDKWPTSTGMSRSFHNAPEPMQKKSLRLKHLLPSSNSLTETREDLFNSLKSAIQDQIILLSRSQDPDERRIKGRYEKVKKELDSLDSTALDLALLLHNKTDLYTKYQSLLQILQKAPSGTSEETLTKEELEYAKEIALLSYSDRTSYLRGCEELDAEPRKDSLETAFYQWVVAEQEGDPQKIQEAKDRLKELLPDIKNEIENPGDWV